MNSMTGFGQGEVMESPWTCRVELVSVNRKQLDIVVSLPRDLAALEPRAKESLSKHLNRGRVTAKIQLEAESDQATGSLKVNRHLAEQYAQHHRELAKTMGDQLAPLDLTRATGVFELEESELDVNAVWPVVEKAISEAIKPFLEMRSREGLHLRKVLMQSADHVRELVAKVREQAPKVLEHHRRSLQRRLEEAGLPLPLDDERLLKEIGLFAERCDVSEEMDRLDSHHDQLILYLKSEEPVGRSLDFLAQEMNREFNTIGSKANDAVLAQLVVEGKTEVEKIREQVQNVE